MQFAAVAVPAQAAHQVIAALFLGVLLDGAEGGALVAAEGLGRPSRTVARLGALW